MQSAWSYAHRLSVTAIRRPRFIAKKHVPAPWQPSSLLLLPRNEMFRLPRLPLTLLHKVALPEGVSMSSFSPCFAVFHPALHCQASRAPTAHGLEAALARGSTPHGYSLRDLFCCLLFYRGEQNSAEEAGLLSMKPIPERTSTALLAG